MIPHLVTVRYRRPDGRWRRLYVPVLPVLLLLSPLLLLAVLATPIAYVATPARYWVSPVGALRGAGRLLWALPGSRFEIEDGQMAVLVSVR